MPDPVSRQPHLADVRMKGFSSRLSVDDAWQWLEPFASRPRDSERIPLCAAAGRILAEEVVSRVAVPGFRRSMMDGYALHAADTFGASPYQPLPLRVVGQSMPGDPFAGEIGRGEAIEIMTGAAVPDHADAVLPAELVDGSDGEKIRVIGHVAPLKNVGMPGEDIVAGTRVLAAGRRLRPQDLGVVSSIGVPDLSVVRRPRVRLIITGNELLPAGTPPCGSAIADANGPMLAALVERDGGQIVEGSLQIVPDDPAALRAVLLTPADVIVVTGGSSVGREDYAPLLLQELGELAVHGIAMRPSSPTGMGRIGEVVVFLLPGNPVSCLCAYDFFAGRYIRRRGGLGDAWPYVVRRLPLRRKLVSVVGRCDYARVTIDGDEVIPLAVSGASVLSSTTRACGFVVVPESSEGFPAGHSVDVYLYG